MYQINMLDTLKLHRLYVNNISIFSKIPLSLVLWLPLLLVSGLPLYVLFGFSKLPSYTYSVLCLVSQLCLTLCNPMDGSPPGSSVHGTLQVRILEWVAMPSSKESSQPRDQTQVSHVAGRFTKEAKEYWSM